MTEEFLQAEREDPLLRENPMRWVLYPIQYSRIHKMYKRYEALFWTAEGIDMAQDAKEWERLTEREQHFLKYVLAVFASASGPALVNLAGRFSTEIQIPEARAFYGFQIAMGNIHLEVYGMLVERYTHGQCERDRVFDAIHAMPAVSEKVKWVTQWLSDGPSFAERLVAFACAESVLCSGTACAIHALRARGLMQGLTLVNELISRDMALQVEFACLVYGLLTQRLPEEVVQSLVQEAVSVERRFICDAVPCDLIGVESEAIATYVEYAADNLLAQLGHRRIFGVLNPFNWMVGFPNMESNEEGHCSERVCTDRQATAATKLDSDVGVLMGADF